MDEWPETGGYSPQIYVREARRMVSDYVMIQADCQSARVAPDPVCLGSYNMDSHNCQRIVQGGYARNEGDVQVGVPKPYPISYRSIVPRVGECENLFVTFAIAASHIAFGSTRMEPVFMMASQSAATAGAFAIDDGVPVQGVDFRKLALQLAANGQVLYWGTSDTNGIILDSPDPAVTLTGEWSPSTSIAGYWGTNYWHDANTNKGTKWVTYVPNIPTSGVYQVYLRWTADPNRATNVPVEIVHAAGTTTLTVNQRSNNAAWVHLLTTNFNAGTAGRLVLRTAGTTGYVIADAARWLPVDLPPPWVQVVASDPVACETGKNARVLFVRPADQSSAAVTVNYALGGTAINGTDVAALPKSLTFPAGVWATNLTVEAIPDDVAEGDRTLTLTLLPDSAYTVGALGNCTVQVQDKPFDAWRFAHFTAAELANPAISGPEADPDGDGATNAQEFATGTAPKNAGSVLRVGIAADAGVAHLAFAAGAGRGYTLQFRDALDQGAWLDLTNFPVLTTDAVQQWTDALPAGVTNRFYRVRLP
jgi:hypothetical protein